MCDEFDSGEIEVFDSGEDLCEDISLEDLSDVMDSEAIEVEDFEMFDDTLDVGEESDIGSIMDETTEFSTDEVSEEEGIYIDAQNQEIIENSAMDNMTDYMYEHNYGKEDYEIYSKDPEWQDLNNDLLEEMGQEPINYDSVGETESSSAMDNMTDYMYEHNYGKEDYETYSKDPEWQDLNNDLLEEMGREPIDYGSIEETDSILEMDDIPETVDNGIVEETDSTLEMDDIPETVDNGIVEETDSTLEMDDIPETVDNGIVEETDSTSEMDNIPEIIDDAVVEETDSTSEMDNVPETIDNRLEDTYEHDYETYGENLDEQELNNNIVSEIEQDPVNYEELNSEVIEPNEKDVQEEIGTSLEEIMNDTEISETLENPNENLDEKNVDTTISDWMDEVDISNEEVSDEGIRELEVETSEVQYQIEHNTDFQNSLLESRPDLADMFEAGEFYEQGNNEFGYEGTCGETTLANTLNRLLETNEFTENDVLRVAIDNNLCEIDPFDPANSGGTSTEQYMELYNEMNQRTGNQLDVKAFDYENALGIEDMASRLEEGSILNIAVDSNVLWDQPRDLLEGAHYSDHWISVTGVERDLNGNIEGFKIVDSGGGESYLNLDKFERCYYGETDSPVIDPTCIVVSKKGK